MAQFLFRLFCSVVFVLFFCLGAPVSLAGASDPVVLWILLAGGAALAAAFWCLGGWEV